MIKSTFKPSWTFWISAFLTLVGAVVCYWIAPNIGHSSLDGLVLQELSLTQSSVKWNENIELLRDVPAKSAAQVHLVNMEGHPLVGVQPELSAPTMNAASSCSPTDSSGLSSCDLTAPVAGAHFLGIKPIGSLFHRALIHVIHSTASWKIPEGAGSADGQTPVAVEVRLDKPWNTNSTPLLFVEGDGRHASFCVVDEGGRLLKCEVVAERSGKKKLRMLRPWLKETAEIEFQEGRKPETPKNLYSEISLIEKKKNSDPEQTVAFTLRDENAKNQPGKLPSIRILSKAPVSYVCDDANVDAVSLCRFYSQFTQSVEVWSESPFKTKKISMKFESKNQIYNPNLTFDDDQIIGIRFQLEQPGRFERSFPRFSAPQKDVENSCLPEKDGFIDCFFRSELPGGHTVMFGIHKPALRPDEVGREATIKVFFPKKRLSQ
jgi:hypothetical protein